MPLAWSLLQVSALLFVLVLFGGETPGNRPPQLSPGGLLFLQLVQNYKWMPCS